MKNVEVLKSIRNEVYIFEEPQAEEEYVIGSDVAEGLDEGDSSTFVGLSRKTKKTVITAEYKLKPDQHAYEQEKN